jgi:6,7-dimethyl-8-ribityllumazine synthase
MKRLAILTTLINPETIAAMEAAARIEADHQGCKIVSVTKTIGCLDMPVVAKHLLAKDDVDGLVVLGAVAKGDTDHDQLVVNMMTRLVIKLSLKANKPVGFGVIGPNATREQFAERTTEYAQRAVQAVVTNIDLLHQ